MALRSHALYIYQTDAPMGLRQNLVPSIELHRRKLFISPGGTKYCPYQVLNYDEPIRMIDYDVIDEFRDYFFFNTNEGSSG